MIHNYYVYFAENNKTILINEYTHEHMLLPGKSFYRAQISIICIQIISMCSRIGYV